MEIISRNVESLVTILREQYPILTIVGPRQSGKTTLSRKVFPRFGYVSLENPDIRMEVELDPKGFLTNYPDGLIIDEFQRVPQLASYLQQIVDDDPRPGRFILTGSRSLEIMDQVSQSLVGRSATVELLPFSYSEIFPYIAAHDLTSILYTGLYPPIYHRNLDPAIWFSNYVRNYLERDVRQLVNIRDLNSFHRFIVLCAGRVGQLINYSDICSELGVSHNTVKAWLSILEAHYVIFFLYPFHANQVKRVVKTPKLYFYDTGLVSWLLSAREANHLDAHPLRGAIFENFCVSELTKSCFNRGERSNFYFWRDKSGHEIDVIQDSGLDYTGIEVKISKTFNKSFLKNLNYLAERDKRLTRRILVSGGEESKSLGDFSIVSWRDIESVTPHQ